MRFTKNLAEVPYQASPGVGIIFPAKSIIIKGEGTIVISPGPFSDEDINRLRKFSAPLTFIAPNNYHNLYLGKMQELFPDAAFFGPKRSAKQSKVKLKNTKSFDSKGVLETYFISGNNGISETVFYHPESESLIITDLIVNMHHKMNLPSKIMFTTVGVYHQLNTSRLVLASVTNKKTFRKSIEDLLKIPFKTVRVNHGTNVTRDAFEKFIKQKYYIEA